MIKIPLSLRPSIIFSASKESLLSFLASIAPLSLTYYLLKRKLIVHLPNGKVLSLRNFSAMCRVRAQTFYTKEPETINWINNMETDSVLLDIGANVGLYSLYAAKYRNIPAYAFEPQPLNYSCLFLNIIDNNLESLVKPFPFAFHTTNGVFPLHMYSGFDWATANSSLDRSVNSHGYSATFQLISPSFALPVDDFYSDLDPQPTHLKIDVDGNECLILNSAKHTLKSGKVKSLLIELAIDHPEFNKTIALLNEYKYTLVEVGKFKNNIANHIFLHQSCV